MRVIAGVCKGRQLKPVPGQSTRPTTDKVKEALFNMIGPFFEGGHGLDLYSGSGALGIEALSRGVDRMIFVDRDPKAIETVKANVDHCHFSEKSEIYRNDAHRALKAVQKRRLQLALIFLDPPYFRQKLEKDLHTIDRFSLLSPEGVVVAEHHESVRLAHSYGKLVLDRSETYGGKTAVSVFRQNNEPESEGLRPEMAGPEQ
ncbi:MAG TPA: 16S rRNA (guanine(966)-N(2))-methyltransferase RsmD [Bacillales bacterium]|nr:16S rRNA (guanine(966)-N(2))-methyltransferase RsmD [Bacillales bacterium]